MNRDRSGTQTPATITVRPLGERSRVLFIDDEPLVRIAFKRLMDSARIEADIAESGVEALALAKIHSYRVVVSDLCLPGITGTTLIQRLKLLQPHAHYAAVTGLTPLEPEYEQASQDEDLTILRKPWSDRELLEIVVSGLDQPFLSLKSARKPRRAAQHVLRVLLLEDSPGDADLYTHSLRRVLHGHCQIERAATLREAVRMAKRRPFDVIVADLSVPDAGELDAVFAFQGAAPTLPLIILTGNENETLGIQAVQSGAQDYLVKGQTDANLLKRSIRYSIERKRWEQRLLMTAQHDPLTGLANRTLFRQRLAHALTRAQRAPRPFAVAVVDLDGFKPVNDRWGHDAGDMLLQALAANLSSAVGTGDTVARLGGDEFAVLLEARDSPMAISSIAQRLLDAIDVSYDLEIARISITASIGVAMYPDAADSVDGLLKAADEAMYHAKEHGRNRFHIAGRDPSGRARTTVRSDGTGSGGPCP